ncbi:cell surface protein SprA [candidate division KSB1 bacterium]|nr:cell surface protein SprA [candidate division KSB1 bacterium]
MQQKQRFSVTGKIGDKVTVNVDQDSERAFDFDNNVRLVYQGYDDEILRKLEAGNISLSLPGTRYVTFSGKNAGLFGIKSEMVLGNLNFTTIASQEKGESQRLSLTGGAQAGRKIIRDHQYLRNTYFFLDESYRDEYSKFNAQRTRLAPDVNVAPPVDGQSIEVYKAAPGNDTRFPGESIAGWATRTGKFVNGKFPENVKEGEAEFGHFIRLEKNEYYVENNLGWIRMNSSVAQNDILAVFYRAGNDTLGNIARQDTILLKLIKSRNTHPSVATAQLEWKHVYILGGRNINTVGFDVKIFREPSSGVAQETDENGKKWLEVFGLDSRDKNGADNPDGEIDLDPTFISLVNGELFFPDLRPFDSSGYFVAPSPDTIFSILPGDRKREPAIYDETNSTLINAQSRFYIEVKSQNSSSDYNLGFNVIEGSEVVTLNGSILRNGVDYTIDYFSGRLAILNEQALNPAAQLDISYERNQLFQLEKKTILGMRAEYELGRDSFIGGTFLYLNQTTLDRKVRVGQGPMRNLVWDINTRFKLKPNFIGKALDFMPLIRAKGETSLNLEGEIAQVLPTPNTLNSSSTGDNSGVAYIDDFEGSKKTVNLGVLRKHWTQASEPKKKLDDESHTYRNMLNNIVWYNPFSQVHINDIYPERELNPNVPNRVHVLTMDFYPDPKDANPDTNTWGGVMRALSPGIFDQTQTKFIEIMVQGDNGRFHIDLGKISEDVIPNDGKFDTEDDAAGLTRNGILDAGEDIGIDGVDKPDPPELNFSRSMFVGDSIDAVPYDFWDIDEDGKKGTDEPWSYDDWFYTESNFGEYIQFDGTGSIVGTENNENDQGGRRPDTEDINGNGFLDQANSYFSYSFSLSAGKDSQNPANAITNNPLIVGGNPDKGWYLYRIPFDTSDPKFQQGDTQPSPTQIEFVRLWVDSLDLSDAGGSPEAPRIQFSIAEINLVGSEWKELGTFDTAGVPFDTTVTVAQINTHENVEYAATLSQIGVEGEIDQVTGVRAREQSLVLVAKDLKPKTSGLAQKSLFRGENYIRYDRIKMFVYGDPNVTSHIPMDSSSTSSLEYFIRFGADTENYYEYRSKIYSGWNELNHMDVLIQDFTTLDTLFNNGTEFDTLSSVFVRSLAPNNSKSIRKKGTPSFTNVKVLILGLKNLHTMEGFTGDIWFNELRLSDVENDKGIAMRARADLRIADFITINGEVERKDADFHNVATRFGTGNNSLSSHVSANVKLDKMLPQSWGLAMPLTVNFRNSNSTPKYVPGQDRLVTDKLPQSQLERAKTKSNQSGFNFSFRKITKSKNFFIRHTVDNISFSLGRTKSDLENPSLRFSNLRAWNGNLDFTLPFGKNNYFKPFSWLPNLPLIGKAKNTKFYYTPQNISFKVNGAKRNQMSQNRVQTLTQTATADTTSIETFTIDRSARANMKIFESLSVDISRIHKADMRGRNFSDFINNNFSDINVTQTFSARYNPRIFDWLNNNFTYSSNYTFANNLQRQTTGRSARASSNKSADFTFKWKDFARSVFGVGKKSTGRRGGRRRTNPNPNSQPLLIFQQEEEGGTSFNPLKLFGSFLSKFKDIRFNYSERINRTHLGLVPGSPSLAFQFGLSDTTNLSSVSSLTTNTISSTDNQSYTASSGLAFGRAIDVALKFQHSEQRNQSTIVSGNSSNSWVKFRQFDLPFPEWTVRIGGLSSLPLFKLLFKSVTFSHSFSGQRDVTWNQTPDNETRRSFTTNFRPLGKLDLNFKNGFTGNIQINNSTTLSQTLTTSGEN